MVFAEAEAWPADTSDTIGRQALGVLLLEPRRSLAESLRFGPRSQALTCGFSQTRRENDGRACLCAKKDALLLGPTRALRSII